MSDQAQVVAALECAAQAGARVALVTVVETIGSTYRRAGARMVVTGDGSTVGTVSAGCLERDVAARALRALADRRFELARYDGRGDDDMAWGEGCGGVVDLLIEPLAPQRAGDVARCLRAALESDEPCLLATVFAASGPDAPRLGARLLACPHGVEHDDVDAWADGRLRALIVDDLWRRAPARGADVRELSVRALDAECAASSARVCVEVIQPTVRLLICGSGSDAEPVARLAAQLGWDVTVLDHRPVSVAGPERFSGARVVECADARLVADVVRIVPRTAAIVMSHHFARDTAYVGALTAAGAGYVAVLGPRSRTSRMLAELAASGAPVLDGAAAAIRAPAGLDIGGEGAEAIALSIIAEVHAVAHGRSGSAPMTRAVTSAGAARAANGVMSSPTPGAVRHS